MLRWTDNATHEKSALLDIANHRTQPIFIPRREFELNHTETPYPLLSLQKYITEELRKRIAIDFPGQRDVTCAKKVLTLPCDGGYLDNCDEQWKLLLIDAYNLGVKHGIQDNRILCDPGKVRLYAGTALPDKAFMYDEYDQQTIQELKSYMTMRYHYAVKWLDRSKIKILAKQSSSPGGFRTSPEGRTWRPKNKVLGLKDVRTKSTSNYAPRYTELKMSMVEYQLRNKVWLKRFLESSREEVLDNLHKFVVNNCVNIFGQGWRLNQVDSDPSFSGKYSGQTLLPKERQFNYYSRGMMCSCLEDRTKYYGFLRSIFNNGFLPRRQRPIKSGNFAVNVVFQAYARCLLEGFEDSKYGMANYRPTIIERYKRFIDADLGKHWLFVQADRSSSERFITSNYDAFRSTYPDFMRHIMEITNIGVEVSPAGIFVMEGVSSGSWSTTLNTSHKGTCTAALLIRDLLKCSIPDIENAEADMYDRLDDWYSINGVSVLSFMNTDDILLVFRSPIPIDSSRININAYNEQKLKISISTESSEGFFGVNPADTVP